MCVGHANCAHTLSTTLHCDYNRAEKWKMVQKSVESELNNHMESVSGKHLSKMSLNCLLSRCSLFKILPHNFT